MIPFFAHKPESLDEFVGQDKAIAKIHSFFSTFKKGKGLFLYGPPGTGKTSCVYAYAKQYNYELLELNASDARSAKILNEFLSKACGQASLFGAKKIILLDEVDGLSGMKDRGAASAIAKFMKSSSFPIVVTGTNVFDKKFSPLKKISTLVEFSSLCAQDTTSILKNMCTLHNISCDDSSLKAIARHTGGDARAALNDLFSFVVVKNSSVDDMQTRRQTEQLADALVRVFKSTNPSVVFGSYDLVNEDLDKIFLWLDENIPREYKNSNDLSKAYDVLALADKFFGRIRKWQYYRYYAYCYLLLSVGIALSKDKKYSSVPQYKQPTRLLKYWQANMAYAKRKSIVEKIASAQNTSKKTALQDSFPLLMHAIANDASLREELDIAPDELAWIKKKL